jgi:DNA primase
LANHSQIDHILQATDIVEVISEVVELQKKGKNYVGLCPFHADSNPSMTVSGEKQIFKCFSCGAGGNALKFVQDFEQFINPMSYTT